MPDTVQKPESIGVGEAQRNGCRHRNRVDVLDGFLKDDYDDDKDAT
jgi:hypothetical protein